MSRSDRRLQRHVDALLKDRRPPKGDVGPDLPAVQMAARLHAAHPGSAEPTPEFVDELARKLRRVKESPSPAAAPSPQRRQFLTAAGLAAAAGIGAGFGIERLREAVSVPGTATPSQGPLTPERGAWVAVARVSELAPGKIQRFSAGGVEGFVLNASGSLRALSAACTDQGCILNADPANGRLVCPCHTATFGLDGVPTTGSYRWRVTPLPAIQLRTTGDSVEVLVPQQPESA
jgi:cytochrome b6-f complex iron-sulfur subunit